MTGLELVDAKARRDVAELLGETLFVEAGAGSGKTTSLVARIAALVETGLAPLTGIAAITFTEAAAAELRIRVRQELEQRAAAASGDAARRLEEALSRIDEAPISTIHGFCRRILAAHPIEAGLPPRFEVLDEVTESLEWQRRFAEELDVLAETPGASDLISLGWLLDITDRRIESLARALDLEWHCWAPPAGELSYFFGEVEGFAPGDLDQLAKAIDLAAAERASCLTEEDGLFLRLENLMALGHNLSSEDWRLSLEAVLATAPFRSVTKLGKRENWSCDIDVVRQLVATAQDAHSSLRQRVLDQIVAGLSAHFQARAVLAAGDRRRRGVLTFHDLIVSCRQLLESNEAVRRAVRSRFLFVLVDEFQDTDLLQLQIARLIGEVGGNWEKGRFFFVGDPKQSIYRFRGADLAAYESAREEIVGSGATLLTSNFRSVPGILSFVNESFAHLLGERFHSLDPVRRPLDSQYPPVGMVGGPMEGKPRRGLQRQMEAEDCCRVIERAVYEEAWPVGDEQRQPRLSDVAILLPRRTGLGELEAALEDHGIPYRVESASLILASQEVRDVLHLARAIGEPGNELALVATLRSPSYSIGDDELVAWANAGGRWTTEAEPPASALEAAPAVGEALADLARLRGRLAELGPLGVLSLAVRERRLLPLAARGPRVRESWRRIRYILERARLFAEAGGQSLGELADWIDEQLRGGVRAAESVVPEDDEDVVRIMTVHGAKGLEFPVTILCGFGTSDATGGADLVLRHDDGRPEVHFKDGIETTGYGALQDREQQLDAEEALRLCYVAATRAKDHLVVCAHHVTNGNKSLGERLHEVALLHPELWRRLPSVLDEGEDTPLPPRRSRELLVGSGALGISSLEQYEEWCEARRLLIEDSSRQANVRATEVASLAGEETSPEGPSEEEVTEEQDSPVPAAHRRGRAGTRIGRAVHATLQSVSMDDAAAIAGLGVGRPGAAERLETIARAQARAERVDERGSEVARLAAAALGSKTVAAALASQTARRELYVATEIGGTVLDGYVDLCFVERDGSLTVVDYKTDSVGDATEAARKAEHYGLQAASYALCLEAATGRAVRRCVLVFLAPPSRPIEHEITGEDLAEKMAAVRQLVGAVR